jgi:RNA polymerase sigma factor (sigma-70 family)
VLRKRLTTWSAATTGSFASRRPSYFLIGGDSDDLIQEGLVGLYKAIRDYRSDRESSFRNFAELCITRQIITAVKTATRNKHTPLNSYVSFSQSPAASGDEGEPTIADVLPGSTVHDPVNQVISMEEVQSLVSCITSVLSELESRCSRCIWTVAPTRRWASAWAATPRPSTTPAARQAEGRASPGFEGSARTRPNSYAELGASPASDAIRRPRCPSWGLSAMAAMKAAAHSACGRRRGGRGSLRPDCAWPLEPPSTLLIRCRLLLIAYQMMTQRRDQRDLQDTTR